MTATAAKATHLKAASAAETTHTRFFVFESDEHLTVWRFVGVREARDRDHALRLFYGKTPPPFCVAVSENAWKPRTPRVETVVTGLNTVAMPGHPFEATPKTGAQEQGWAPETVATFD